MYYWDIFIVVMLAIAVFRGYQQGLFSRMSSWVGVVVSGCVVFLKLDAIHGRIEPMVHGQKKIEKWLLDYFEARSAANPDNNLEKMKSWIASLPLPNSFKEGLYGNLDKSADAIYSSIYAQTAHLLSEPVWRILLFIGAVIVTMAVLVVVSLILDAIVRHIFILDFVNRIVGALVSGMMMMVVVGLFTAICIFFMPESSQFGQILQHSFMAPRLHDAVEVLLQGGMHG